MKPTQQDYKMRVAPLDQLILEHQAEPNAIYPNGTRKYVSCLHCCGRHIFLRRQNLTMNNINFAVKHDVNFQMCAVEILKSVCITSQVNDYH